MPRSLLRLVALAQGIYYAATGAWAIVHVDSFMLVTGPKTDVWLVKTVAVCVLAIAIALLMAAARRAIAPEVVVLAVASALGLAAIDAWYALVRQIISPVYLLDAAAEIALVVGWAIAWRAGAPMGARGAARA